MKMLFAFIRVSGFLSAVHSRLLPLALLLACAAHAADTRTLFAQGLKAYAGEEYDRAAGLFEQATREEPRVWKYHYWLGKAFGRRAERANPLRAWGLAKKTVSEFERAVELDGSNQEALSDLLDYYLHAPGIVGGGDDKAVRIAARLAEISAAEGHRAQALLLAKKKDYAGAEREYRQALELEPQKQGRLLELASFLSERGRHAEADELFGRAAALKPDSPDYLFARGRALAQAGRDPKLARELLERYLRSPRQPDDPPPSEVQSLLKKL